MAKNGQGYKVSMMQVLDLELMIKCLEGRDQPAAAPAVVGRTQCRNKVMTCCGQIVPNRIWSVSKL
jgi:hypothetical protein